MRFRWRGGKAGSGLRQGQQGFGDERRTLDHLLPGKEGIISVVPPGPHLAALGLRPGKKVLVHARETFGGPVIVEIEGRHVALGRGVVRRILLQQEAH